MRGFRGGGAVGPDYTGPDPLEIYKAFKPAFNVGPSSAPSENAI